MTKKRSLMISILVLVLVATAYAQKFGEAVQVTVIEVPVTVVDRNGNPVRGLTKDDFELFDDGRKVPIDYFEVVDMTTISATRGADAPPPPAAATRNFLLLFDLANSSPGTIGRATEAAKEFVETQLGERDLAAVAVFTANTGARMITSFTRSRSLLTNAIETLGHPKYFKVTDPLAISATRVQVETQGDGAGSGGRASLEEALAELAGEKDRVAQVSADSEARNRLKIQVQSFGNVARSLDRLKGQKQVILLSEGFDARLAQGRENLSRESTQKETDAVFSGEVWSVDQEQRFGSAGSSTDIRQMADLFRRSDVVMHAIDIKGLRGNVDASSTGAAKKSSFEGLTLLTRPTGGTVFKNVNDLGSNFARMLKQQEVVYLLGFTARGTGKPGKFHELKVKAKGGQVSHRAGYYEGTAMSPLEKTFSLAEILMTDAPISEVDISVAATPLPGPGGKARVPVVVEMPGGRLLEGIAGGAATADVFVYAFDAKNEVADVLQQRISLDMAKAGETVRGSGVRYFGTLRLPPGQYAVKTLVRVDQSGRTGFVRSDLTVPAFDSAVVLPPLLFTEPANWVTLVSPPRDGDNYAYPFSAGEATYVPKRSASFSPNNDYKIAVFMYRVPLDNLQVTPEIVTNGSAHATDDVKLLGRTAADDRGGIKLLFNFRPEGLPAGEHELRFKIKSKDGNESVVAFPFRVL